MDRGVLDNRMNVGTVLKATFGKQMRWSACMVFSEHMDTATIPVALEKGHDDESRHRRELRPFTL